MVGGGVFAEEEDLFREEEGGLLMGRGWGMLEGRGLSLSREGKREGRGARNGGRLLRGDNMDGGERGEGDSSDEKKVGTRNSKGRQIGSVERGLKGCGGRGRQTRNRR